MIRSYTFGLSSAQPFAAAYPLYAAMLERAPAGFAADLHESTVTPVSQSVRADRWQVSLFGADAIDALAPVLEGMDEVFLRRDRTRLGLQLQEIAHIDSVDQLLDAPPLTQGTMKLVTPTAFKSGGAYQLLPSQRLILQSLILKWNGCFGGVCPIEDEGGGLEALAEGLRCVSVRLDTRNYPMKRTQIPGVVGSIGYQCTHNGFHRQLANALLTFGQFSGVGIKTALGMGGLQIETK